MKKNISINICGTIYAIDEDAYQLLENYLESMKNYFRNQEGGEEIADDIEHRVAELLWERKEQGMEAVNIETVKDIIDKVGNPAEIDNDASSHKDDTPQEEQVKFQEEEHTKGSSLFERMRQNMNEHRLYRNTEDKMLGGICSGMAEYFGVGDVVIWRLGTILVAFLLMSINIWFVPEFIHILTPVLYIILWIIVPVAKTPEDKLRMKGRKVTPENLKEQIVNDSEKAEGAPNSPRHSNGSGCLKIIFCAFLLFLLFPLIMSFIALVFGMFMLFTVGVGLSSITTTLIPGLSWLPQIANDCGPMLWLGLMAGIITVGIPIYGIIRLIRSNQKPMSTGGIVTLIITWIIAVGLAISALVVSSVKIHSYWDEQYKIDRTRNGITLYSTTTWSNLDELGWTLKTISNINDWITEGRTGYGQLPSCALSFVRSNNSKPVSINLERREFFDEGYYVLESLTELDGNGINIQAIDNNDSTKVATSINLKDAGTDIWKLDWAEGSKLPIFINPDSTGWNEFANNGNEKWTYHVSKPFKHKNGDITIKILADKAYINKFRIRQIQLRKIEK